jgi:putative ABC transport system permease protein
MKLGFWLKWSWRDLRSRWLQVLIIALVIALGTGLSAGLTAQGTWRMDSIDLSYERLNMYDLHVELSTGSFIEQEAALAALADIDGVDIAEARLVSPTLVDASYGDKTVLVRGEIYGVDVSGDGPHVNQINVDADEGRTLAADDAGQDTAVLEVKFARHHEIEPGATVQVSGGETLEVVGLGVSPEHFIIMPESGSYLSEGSYAVLYMPLSTAQRIAGREGLVNDIVISLAAGADYEAVQAAVESRLIEIFPDTGFEITYYADEFIYSAMQDEAVTIEETWSAIGALFLVGAAVGAFNLIGRMVESQRRQIGIGMALGVSRRWLAFRPILVGLQIAVVGIIAGPFVGLAINQAFADWTQQILAIPFAADAQINPDGAVQGTILGILIPLFAVLVPVWRAVRVQPVDAITSGYLVAKGGGLSKLADYIPVPGKSFTHMPIRNVLRAPWRTILTVMGVAIAIVILLLFGGIIDSYVLMLDDADTDFTHQAPGRALINLNAFYSTDSEQVAGLRQAASAGGEPLFETTETALSLGGTIKANGEEQDISIELHDMDNAIWVPTLKKGSLKGDEPGIVLSAKTAQDLDVEVGDTVVLEHPQRSGETAFRMVESEFQVAGIHANPLRYLSYIDMAYAGMMGLDDMTNYLIGRPAAGIDADTMRLALMERSGVASMRTATEFSDAVRDMLKVAMDMMNMVEIVMLFLAFLIAFNTTSISLDERVREIATMFAFGTRIRTVLRMHMLENLIIGALGTIAGVLVGLPILNAFIAAYEDMALDFKFVATLSPTTLVIALGLGTLVVALTPLFSVRRMRKMDIPSTLRVME